MKPLVASISVALAASAWCAAHPLESHGVNEIVFAARMSGTDHYYVNFGYYVTDPRRKGYRDGGSLCRLDLRTGQVRVLLEDPKGGVRDPQMHYGGQKVLFSYRKGGQPYYHLYEIDIDGTNLRQLTSGAQDDIEPTYLPDGSILFGSSRCNRMVACWYTPVVILYRCDGDGSNVRMLSSSIVHDNTPWVLPDGRVLYTRWEYVDRSRVRFHHLWTINADGTGQMTYFGNMHGGTVMLDAKPIPGTQKVVASFSPGHGRPEHMGHITVIDPNAGPDCQAFARRLNNDASFRDPYPLSEDAFLVARGKGIFLMDGQGQVEPLYALPSGSPRDVHEPRPLRARPRERTSHPRIDVRDDSGILILMDVRYGRNTAGVGAGEVKKLLVLEQLSKAVNFSGTMEPITLGGAFTLKRILGTVPVEPDGSAYMRIPALRSLFFVALDESDLSVKRMQSFVTVQPGEVTSCAGCHEPRTNTPPYSAELMALRRPPSEIDPIPGVPGVMDFPRDIQPILDRHCVKCHDAGHRAGGAVLTGDHGPRYSLAYATLMGRGLVSHGRDANGNHPPRSIGSSASRLRSKIDGTHNRVRVSEDERRMIRLWIETGAPYPGTYAALGTGMVGIATRGNAYRACAACHKYDERRKSLRLPVSEEVLFNLSHPEKSLVLLAPLSPDAGGYGVCRPRPKQRAPKSGQKPAAGLVDPDGGTGRVLPNTADPTYQAILAEVMKAANQLKKARRFDMPGFRPNVHYIREYQRAGALPSPPHPDAPIDVYAADEAYWQSFWHRPSGD